MIVIICVITLIGISVAFAETYKARKASIGAPWLLVWAALSVLAVSYVNNLQSKVEGMNIHVAAGEFYRCQQDKTIQSFTIDNNVASIVNTDAKPGDQPTKLDLTNTPKQKLEVGAKYCSKPDWKWYPANQTP